MDGGDVRPCWVTTSKGRVDCPYPHTDPTRAENWAFFTTDIPKCFITNQCKRPRKRSTLGRCVLTPVKCGASSSSKQYTDPTNFFDRTLVYSTVCGSFLILLVEPSQGRRQHMWTFWIYSKWELRRRKIFNYSDEHLIISMVNSLPPSICRRPERIHSHRSGETHSFHRCN
jgi:hypothetical protein